MLIEDGTGQMDARSWLDPSSEDGGQRDEWQVNSYVRIIGTLKTFSTKRHINVNRCRKVEDYNEILFHPLECIFVHKFYANHGQLPGQSASAINSTTYDSGNNPYAGDGGATSNDGGGGGGGAEPYADLPSGQRRIMQFVSDLVANGTAGDEGVNVNQIVRGVGGPHGKIQEEVKNLINDGHLYETIDDDHVLPTAS